MAVDTGFQLALKVVLVTETASFATGAAGNVSTAIVIELAELPEAFAARAR